MSNSSNYQNEDEWTFVSSNKRKNQTKKSKSRIQQHQLQLDKAKQVHNILSSNNDAKCHNHDERNNNIIGAVSDKDCLLLSQAIEHCMNNLENFNSASIHRNYQRNANKKLTFSLNGLLASLKIASSTATMNNPANQLNNQIDNVKIKTRKINEIISYGIGNFARKKSARVSSKSSSSGGVNGKADFIFDSSSAPIIQLACILLIRQHLATDMLHSSYAKSSTITREKGDSSHQHIQEGQHQGNKLAYEHQQLLVPIVYFEPLIKPIECKVLTEIFHVQILEINERGKRRVASNQNDTSSTLFYMPHCPMRLYSNILWSNWDVDLLFNGRTVIFGNSLNAYEDRIISSEQKKDTTNAIFPILPFVNEQQVLVPPSSSHYVGDSATDIKNSLQYNIVSSASQPKPFLSWQDLEMAFNDCVVISFSNIDGDQENIELPLRPAEHIGNETDDEVV